MRHALVLATRGLGRVAPNPAVGCVIVDAAGHIAGRGWTGAGGRPHAETVALARAGPRAKGATAYVTLEPCSHHGVTPPCAEALIAAGVARVVGAAVDPDPRVQGRGFARLKEAGVAVTPGVLEAEARALNAGFIKRIEQGRPLVALKIAQSADGFVAGPPGTEKWITGEAARRHGHLLRSKYDAIMVGIGTVLADDPLLTCRLPGLEDRSPMRIVLDTSLRLPPGSQLVRSARTVPVLVFTVANTKAQVLERMGVEIARMEPGRDGRPDLFAVLKALAERGLTRLLVEGGPAIQAALLARDLVDEVHMYSAPAQLGGGLRSAIQMPNAKLCLVSRDMLPPDVLESYEARG